MSSGQGNINTIHIPMQLAYTTSSPAVIGVGGTINSSSGQISGFTSILPNNNPSNVRILPSQSYTTAPHNVQLQTGSISGQLQIQGSYVQQNNVTLSPLVNQNYVISTPTQLYLQSRHIMDDSNSIAIHQSEAGGSNHGPPEPSAPPENRLKVEDALNYLDQVKYKFSSQPQVYNDFLDIMKEFKSQSIDTPGVITRVSNLFQGHPELIVGFNTFLPPGFKVEISYGAGQNQGRYTVTTVQTDPQGGSDENHPELGPARVIRSSQPSVNTQSGRIYNGSNDRLSPPPAAPAIGGGPSFDCISLQNPPTGAEFNHAVNYVNKIKNRFNEQPEKYKQFLDILQLYQKEKRSANKHSTEKEVFSQMAKLFENQEDLLLEFRQFLLPEATHNQNMTIKSVIDQAKESAKLNGDKPTGRKKPAPAATKRRAAPKQGQAAPTTKRRKSSVSESTPPSGRPGDLPDLGNPNEIALFEKIRKAMISSKYQDFLRSLKLYNDGVLHRSELLSMVKPALTKLGTGNYFQAFKDFLSGHSDEEPAAVAPKSPPPGKVSKALQTIEIIDPTNCNRIGECYVELPKDHCSLKASGRSELDNLVLNETWQIVPPKKIEAPRSNKLKKHDLEEFELSCEDERFELDMVMEPNVAAIRGFEHTAKKMSRMTAEELKVFRLDETLGGRSDVIFQKAIRLVYGEDMGPKIIDGMRSAPNIAIPLVLRRLKDKDREWRSAQKGFNQQWREQLEKFTSHSTESSSRTKHNDAKDKDKETKASKAALAAAAAAAAAAATAAVVAAMKAEPESVNDQVPTPSTLTAGSTPPESEQREQPETIVEEHIKISIDQI